MSSSGASIGAITESFTCATKHQTTNAHRSRMPTVSTAGVTNRLQRTARRDAFSMLRLA